MDIDVSPDSPTNGTGRFTGVFEVRSDYPMEETTASLHVNFMWPAVLTPSSFTVRGDDDIEFILDVNFPLRTLVDSSSSLEIAGTWQNEAGMAGNVNPASAFTNILPYYEIDLNLPTEDLEAYNTTPAEAVISVQNTGNDVDTIWFEVTNYYDLKQSEFNISTWKIEAEVGARESVKFCFDVTHPRWDDVWEIGGGFTCWIEYKIYSETDPLNATLDGTFRVHLNGKENVHSGDIGEDDDGIPGFEPFLIVISIGILILIERRSV